MNQDDEKLIYELEEIAIKKMGEHELRTGRMPLITTYIEGRAAIRLRELLEGKNG